MSKFFYCIIILLSSQAIAQNYVDIVNIGWDEGFQNEYGVNNETARFTEFTGDLTIPIVASDNFVILSGITSEIIQVDFSENTPDMTLYGIGLKLGMNIIHNEKWSGTYLSIPKISADEFAFNSQNFQIGWIALLKRTITPNKNFKLGFYTNSEIFGPFLVPILGYYTLTDRWEINILAPLSAQFDYILAPNAKAGIHFKGIIKSYELNQLPGYITKANNELSLATTVNLGKFVWLTNVGTTLGRRVRIYPDESKMDFALSALKIGDNRVQTNEDLSDGLFIKSSLILRIPTN